ncbi:sulfopyruvate decarboxylase subunit alpha [Methanosphaera sp. WGK6]|uniref:sulfopyruvate decarboxylase subunit alpha n=1 Tax=Methanosphaera sp. WGK6 TaxID=1561964 RepID=UPI00084C2988|nr:sulfopyruvate decarboxylase subunit alpha [Methanosphaera sp. WGK6]OED30251.1 sulfopyruvate decarboxylase subunit alpha [Methanosphaera sp. WGK6]
MDSTDVIYDGLKDAGINFIVSVPCANLKKLLKLIDEDDEIKHVPVTREEEGFGICAGAYMGGLKPAILMQNSGLGNSVNVLASLMKLYNFPIIMIISHRGTFGEAVYGQVPMGKATTKIFDSLDIRYEKVINPCESKEIIKKAWDLSEISGESYALLFDISYWKRSV